jgi:hypothetical protein
MKSSPHVVTVVRREQKLVAKLEQVSERIEELRAQLAVGLALEEQLTDELIALRNARR